jgi:hypothetical protein
LVGDYWPRRNDCVVATSKGQRTGAMCDLIDKIAATDEPVQVFCLHDCDAAGTVIWQSLQHATRYRPARKVQVIDLGLNYEEAIALVDAGRARVENFKRRRQDRPVGRHIDPDTREWFQSHRVELDVFKSREFIAWLDKKLDGYVGRLIPPPEVLAGALTDDIREELHEQITKRILAEADIPGQVKTALEKLKEQIDETASDLHEYVSGALEDEPEQGWSDAVLARALEMLYRDSDDDDSDQEGGDA